MLQHIRRFATAFAFALAIHGVAHSQSNLDFHYLQIYSSPDGAIQYIVLEIIRDPNWDGNYGSASEGQPILAEQRLGVSDGTTEHVLTFASNQSTTVDAKAFEGGARHGHILVATQSLPISTW
jgi:hypothetical protein